MFFFVIGAIQIRTMMMMMMMNERAIIVVRCKSVYGNDVIIQSQDSQAYFIASVRVLQAGQHTCHAR